MTHMVNLLLRNYFSIWYNHDYTSYTSWSISKQENKNYIKNYVGSKLHLDFIIIFLSGRIIVYTSSI